MTGDSSGALLIMLWLEIPRRVINHPMAGDSYGALLIIHYIHGVTSRKTQLHSLGVLYFT
jgi:hypothetical protein